ncbi:MAG: Hopanoid biosynthesis associated protein HpnK [Verrucomicrobiales bacterium]|nr:Hopanoid biosynthesis associated protein HpnK [Verrucomicrobiales bacterium]
MRRLIVNADDFGRSHSINAAVIRAHRDGILTTASLMVNEVACAEAVKLAKENPRLGVGLHLALVCGTSALSQEIIPGLVDAQKQFTNNPVAAGFRYFFSAPLKEQLRLEIAAQFAKFHATGLRLDHVNGHLNIHLHPVIFDILMENAEQWGIKHLRLTRDSFRENANLASGQWGYRLSHAFIYRLLSQRSKPLLARKKIRHTDRVFGLLQNARVDEEFILKLLPQLPAGDSELYSHPSLDEFKHELDALISPRVKALVRQDEIELIRYQDL